MSKPKLHHHLAQVIQKEFSKNKKTIFRYDKITKIWGEVGIRGNAAISQHNTIYNHKGEKNLSFENILGKEIDHKFLDLVNHIKNRLPLTEKKEYIDTLLSFSFSRAPKQRNNWIRVIKDLNKQLNNFGIHKELTLQSLQNEVILASLAETNVMGRVMGNSYFWIACAEGKTAFITSDNPCGSSAMPLTPHFAIMSSSAPKDSEYFEVPEEFVKTFNQITFNNADRYIYALEKINMAGYENNEFPPPNTVSNHNRQYKKPLL